MNAPTKKNRGIVFQLCNLSLRLIKANLFLLLLPRCFPDLSIREANLFEWFTKRTMLITTVLPVSSDKFYEHRTCGNGTVLARRTAGQVRQQVLYGPTGQPMLQKRIIYFSITIKTNQDK